MRIGRTIPPAASPIYVRDIIAGFKSLLRGQQELESFKSELKAYLSIKHCFLVSSGKAALTLILQALKDMHPERDEVLIPAFICYSVPSAIVRAGLKIKLCDINPNTLDFDFTQLSKILSQYSSKTTTVPNDPCSLPQAKRFSSEAALRPDASSSRLLAIIPAHLFGLPADIEQLRKIVDNPQVVIIEDAAQTMGAEWKGKKLGTLGDVSFFSLGRGKALSTVEGGIIVTDRDDISDRISARMKEIRNYDGRNRLGLVFRALALAIFQRPALFWLPNSLPFLRLGDTIYELHFKIRKMSAFQAGLAKRWQKKLAGFTKSRAENTRHWSKLIQSLRNFQLTSETYVLSAMSYELGVGQPPPLIRFPVRFDDEDLRTELLRKSRQMGLGIMFTYPDSINGIQELKASFDGQDFAEAKKTAHQLITLPIHPFLSHKDKAHIGSLISQVPHQ